MDLQLFDKMLMDKCMILHSFIEQSRNNLKIAVIVTFNIYDPFNVFVHKKRHLVNELDFL